MSVKTAPRRRDRLIRERVHDPYKLRLKMPDPAVCPQCGAVYRSDRWQWAPRTKIMTEIMCQACQRINDKYPAGELTLNGSFAFRHWHELLSLARRVEKQETATHPLNRIMEVVEAPDEFVITTTDIHLPRRIGQAMFDAYEGEFNFQYDKEGYFVRVTWHRED